MFEFYVHMTAGTFAADGTIPIACSRNALFPVYNYTGTAENYIPKTDGPDGGFLAYNSSGPEAIPIPNPVPKAHDRGSGPSALASCIDAIWAPRTLNPDLAGIGVSLNPYRKIPFYC